MFTMQISILNLEGRVVCQPPPTEVTALPEGRTILHDGDIYGVAKDKILTATSVADGLCLKFINDAGETISDIKVKIKDVEIDKIFSILSVTTPDGYLAVTVHGEEKGTYSLVVEREEEEDIVAMREDGTQEVLANIHE